MMIYQDSTQPVEKRIEDLLSRMTLEEKAGQLNQLFSEHNPEKLPAFFPDIREGRISSFIWGMVSPGSRKKLKASSTCLRNQVQRVAVEESRLGIPILFGMDTCALWQRTPLTTRPTWSLQALVQLSKKASGHNVRARIM